MGAATTATWHGFVGLNYGDSRYESNKLVLTINFDSFNLGRITTPANAPVSLVNTSPARDILGTLQIAGAFDDYGLVTGVTILTFRVAPSGSSRTHNGILTGLIGEDGVVAAFISNKASDQPHAGVFAANDNVCANNPFDETCLLTQYNTERERIIAKCSVRPAPMNDDECDNLLKPVMCIPAGTYSNPFVALCENNGTKEDLRKVALLRQKACFIDIGVNPNCEEFRKAPGVNSEVWRQTAIEVVEDPGGGDDVETDLTIRDEIRRVYDTANPDLEFWGAGQTVESVRNRSEDDDNVTDFTVTTLNLADGGGDDLLGDAGDGAGYGTVVWNTNETKKFAWILPTTNLGPAISPPGAGAPTMATWEGRASLLFGTTYFHL